QLGCEPHAIGPDLLRQRRVGDALAPLRLKYAFGQISTFHPILLGRVSGSYIPCFLVATGGPMNRQQVNPWTWQDRAGFSQAWRVDDAQSIVFVSGQAPISPEGELVGEGDFEAQ